MEQELFDAANFGDVFGILSVLKTNPNLNVNIRDRLGRTPLCLAVTNEHEEVNVPAIYFKLTCTLLPLAYEVRGKVMF